MSVGRLSLALLPFSVRPAQERVILLRSAPATGKAQPLGAAEISELWGSLRPLTVAASYGDEAQAGSLVSTRTRLSAAVPDGLYKFVVDMANQVWICSSDHPHSALVPKGASVRGAGSLYIRGGNANVNGRSGHFMAERPFLGDDIAAYDIAIRETFLTHGVKVIQHDSGLGGPVLTPP